jgi:hypothetical protein
MNVFFRVFGLEKEELRDYRVGDMVVNGRTQEDDPVLQQA